ncbi:hypothetical protein PF011_g30791 [Phytophthora fragariae]|uniref:Uncharacterized protein n=1 Tax=Phytophthora fragariae TaxID=53985 RepID=A0A6A3GRX0_9STRA|nr:hypothetical protein PF011_g30791 [Phytophthora fragariae]
MSVPAQLSSSELVSLSASLAGGVPGGLSSITAPSSLVAAASTLCFSPNRLSILAK